MQAVDLYVLERAFISTHEDAEPLVNEVMRAYKVRKNEVINRVAHARSVKYIICSITRLQTCFATKISISQLKCRCFRYWKKHLDPPLCRVFATDFKCGAPNTGSSGMCPRTIPALFRPPALLGIGLL